ncbi:HAD family phosphatase [Actinoallomurus liliacearum]
MVVRAVVFDIGGVLEITPKMDFDQRWEKRLGFAPGEIGGRMADVWAAGAVGTITEDDVHRAVRERLGLSEQQVDELMADMWKQYLGVANTDLIEYARALRSRCRTGILSNSFVGAREREQATYGFEDLVDEIVYSHEVGMCKPDPWIYELTCARLGVSPEEMVFLDDVEVAVDAASRAGIHAVLYRDNDQAIGEIEALLATD